jgi:hypothetical protein
MKKIIFNTSLVLFAILFVINSSAQEKKDFKVACIAFYNVENLFDTINTPGVNDFEFTPEGPNKWGSTRYNEKLNNLAKVISQIGTEHTPHGPAIIGLSEIENRIVLEDLVNTELLKSKNYQIVHFDGPDRRGVDVALFYQPTYFKVTNSKSYRLKIPDRDDFFTRDQLLVSGEFHGEMMHIIVNHWPSRSGGESKSRPLRNAAAALSRHIIDSLQALDPNAKIIHMGDLNDNPDNESVLTILRSKPSSVKLEAGDLLNPFFDIYKKGIGTLAWRDIWSLFDIISVSQPLIEKDFSSYRFYRAFVFNKPFLQQQSGRFKGYPFRMFAGGQYLGGYSDHFPTYILLVKER